MLQWFPFLLHTRLISGYIVHNVPVFIKLSCSIDDNDIITKNNDLTMQYKIVLLFIQSFILLVPTVDYLSLTLEGCFHILC